MRWMWSGGEWSGVEQSGVEWQLQCRRRKTDERIQQILLYSALYVDKTDEHEAPLRYVPDTKTGADSIKDSSDTPNGSSDTFSYQPSKRGSSSPFSTSPHRSKTTAISLRESAHPARTLGSGCGF